MLLRDQFDDVWDDPVAELKKLRETDGIVNYHNKFELIRTSVSLSEASLVNHFLAGFGDDMQSNIRMFHPQTVSQCLMLGRFYETAHPRKTSSPMWTNSRHHELQHKESGIVIMKCDENNYKAVDDKEVEELDVPELSHEEESRSAKPHLDMNLSEFLEKTTSSWSVPEIVNDQVSQPQEFLTSEELIWT